MYIKDNTRTVWIKMVDWTDEDTNFDFAPTFFTACHQVKYINGECIVNSVDDCIKIAKNWERENRQNLVIIREVK